MSTKARKRVNRAMRERVQLRRIADSPIGVARRVRERVVKDMFGTADTSVLMSMLDGMFGQPLQK